MRYLFYILIRFLLIGCAEISPREISDDSDSIANAKQKCLNRGLQTGTEEFGECVLKLSK